MMVNYYSARTIVVPLIFISILLVYLIAPIFAVIVPPSIPLLMRLVKKYYAGKVEAEEKKLKEESTV
jgi:ABC-type transport system involved in cytochrome bd biosynthesis fused ATPase/permease subunit